MTILHAFPRTAAFEVHLPSGIWKFKPNDTGDVTCNVTDEGAVERLLSISDHYRVYEDQSEPAPVQKVTLPAGDEKYVLKSGDGQVLDLRPLTDEQLHEFCKANNIAVHPNAKGNTIRDRIVASLAV